MDGNCNSSRRCPVSPNMKQISDQWYGPHKLRTLYHAIKYAHNKTRDATFFPFQTSSYSTQALQDKKHSTVHNSEAWNSCYPHTYPSRKVFSLEVDIILPLSIPNFRTRNYSHIPEMYFAMVTLRSCSQMVHITHQPSHYINMVVPND